MSVLKQQRIWQYIRQHRIVSIIAGHVIVMTVLAVVFLSGASGHSLFGAFAQSTCASGDQTYMVVGGDTLGIIATRYNTSAQNLANYNKIANINTIYIDQHICIPGNGTGVGAPVTMPAPNGGGVRGQGNFFPYAQCTWWANQRYSQLHGAFVPWTNNSNAWQWTARAYDFHWTVSNQPSVGAIIDLQPWVQGAYGLGHVAVVEQVLDNGHVIASSMNWAGHGNQVTNAEFVPGSGVTFITLQ